MDKYLSKVRGLAGFVDKLAVLEGFKGSVERSISEVGFFLQLLASELSAGLFEGVYDILAAGRQAIDVVPVDLV